MPLTKLTYCLRRKPSMTWEEFSTYWRTVHAPLVKERAAVLGIKRYVQVRTVQNADLLRALQARNGGSPEPYDGIAELWYDPAERGAGGDAARTAGQELLEDERNFIDLPNSPIWYGEEWEVVAQP